MIRDDKNDKSNSYIKENHINKGQSDLPFIWTY